MRCATDVEGMVRRVGEGTGGAGAGFVSPELNVQFFVGDVLVTSNFGGHTAHAFLAEMILAKKRDSSPGFATNAQMCAGVLNSMPGRALPLELVLEPGQANFWNLRNYFRHLSGLDVFFDFLCRGLQSQVARSSQGAKSSKRT